MRYVARGNVISYSAVRRLSDAQSRGVAALVPLCGECPDMTVAVSRSVVSE